MKIFNFNKISFEGYKCFKQKTVISDLKPISIIIGKNNIGKSSFLDIIEFMNDPLKISETKNLIINIEKKIEENEISAVFPKDSNSSNIPGINDYDFGKKFIGQNFEFNLSVYKNSTNWRFDKKMTYDFYQSSNDVFLEEYAEKWSYLARIMKYTPKITKRIYAERNIVSEKEKTYVEIDGYGNGITTIINQYLNVNNYDENKVRVELLKKLNEIMGIDANFKEIITQQINSLTEETEWEIFLVEEKKGKIALSKSGSGLKTILMILVYTILIPHKEQKEISEYVFLFEELENNLHPSLLRRVLKYIEEISKQNANIFLTTHSNVMLDSFQNNDNVQIYHVIKNEENAEILALSEINSIRKCIDNIGAKASDILQSNCIIWVEGPSDRIYINKWIELWSEGKYSEGLNYQCMFYGGRLLSHLKISDEEAEDLINLLNINKNSIIVIDSDKKTETSRINATKSRINSKSNENDQICWITSGNEIENYISKDVIELNYSKKNQKEFGKYSDIGEYLELFNKGEENKFNSSKVNYAKKFCDLMTKDNMQNSLDLDNKMNLIINKIKLYNDSI